MYTIKYNPTSFWVYINIIPYDFMVTMFNQIIRYTTPDFFIIGILRRFGNRG